VRAGAGLFVDATVFSEKKGWLTPSGVWKISGQWKEANVKADIDAIFRWVGIGDGTPCGWDSRCQVRVGNRVVER